eukprot:gene23110-29944_t
MKMAIDITDAPGQVAPTGLFDPLGLSTTASSKDLKRWRESELKHGRIAMLSTVGILTAEYWNPVFKSVDGAAIYHFQEVENLFNPFWYIGLLFIGVVESYSILKGWELPGEVPSGQKSALLKDDYVVGDLGFDPLGFRPKGSTNENAMSKEFISIRTKELQNGRLAMIGVAGMIAQELVDKRTISDHFFRYGFGAATQAISQAATQTISQATTHAISQVATQATQAISH